MFIGDGVVNLGSLEIIDRILKYFKSPITIQPAGCRNYRFYILKKLLHMLCTIYGGLIVHVVIVLLYQHKVLKFYKLTQNIFFSFQEVYQRIQREQERIHLIIF